MQLYLNAYTHNLYSKSYIDSLTSTAHKYHMDTIARSTKQLGAAVRRHRRLRKLSQDALGQKAHTRQATVSKLEAGEPGTQLRTLMDALAALDLELVVRPRSKALVSEIEDIF